MTFQSVIMEDSSFFSRSYYVAFSLVIISQDFSHDYEIALQALIVHWRSYKLVYRTAVGKESHVSFGNVRAYWSVIWELTVYNNSLCRIRK